MNLKWEITDHDVSYVTWQTGEASDIGGLVQFDATNGEVVYEVIALGDVDYSCGLRDETVLGDGYAGSVETAMLVCEDIIDLAWATERRYAELEAEAFAEEDAAERAWEARHRKAFA